MHSLGQLALSSPSSPGSDLITTVCVVAVCQPSNLFPLFQNPLPPHPTVRHPCPWQAFLMVWGDAGDSQSSSDDCKLDMRPHVLTTQASLGRFSSLGPAPHCWAFLPLPSAFFLFLSLSSLITMLFLSERKIKFPPIFFLGEILPFLAQSVCLGSRPPSGCPGSGRMLPENSFREAAGLLLPGALAKVGSGSFTHSRWDEAASESSSGTTLPSTGQARWPPSPV